MSDAAGGFFTKLSNGDADLFQYVFMTETIAGPKQKTVHEELAQYLKAALRPNQADQLIVSKFLKHIWFFFEILIKSMAQYLLSTDRIKVHVACCLLIFVACR